MNELEKVRPVVNPHLTLFVGDALAGNDAVGQGESFKNNYNLMEQFHKNGY